MPQAESEQQRFFTPEDYIEKLKREIFTPESNPQLYEFEGSYAYVGQINIHYGTVLIDDNMAMVGEIRDPSSSCRKHVVKGSIANTPEGTRMRFEKIPTGELLPIHYDLLKTARNGGIDGDYEGIWSFKELCDDHAVGFRRNKDGTVDTIMHPEEKNKATLLLRKV